jgi:hypothetical protein
VRFPKRAPVAPLHLGSTTASFHSLSNSKQREVSDVSVLAAGFFLSLFAAGGASPQFAVGPQYDTTHVYVAPQDFDRFVASLIATFGGTASKQGVFTATPTPSSTMSQLVLTPAGTLSVFGFKTPIPYPFGVERTGYLVTGFEESVKAVQADGADNVVAPFNDPIGGTQ